MALLIARAVTCQRYCLRNRRVVQRAAVAVHVCCMFELVHLFFIPKLRFLLYNCKQKLLLNLVPLTLVVTFAFQLLLRYLLVLYSYTSYERYRHHIENFLQLRVVLL